MREKLWKGYLLNSTLKIGMKKPRNRWLNSYKEVNLISTVSQWISVCLLEIRLISNGDMDGLLYGAYYGQASL